MKNSSLLLFVFIVSCSRLVAQDSEAIVFADDSMAITGFSSDGKLIEFGNKKPLVSYKLGNLQYSSLRPSTSIKIKITGFSGNRGFIQFENRSADTLRLHNVVPLGADSSHLYITGFGDHELSRTHLFQPGESPVNVIVPDNAWELGFSSTDLDDSLALNLLVRRDRSSIVHGSRTRFETILYPGRHGYIQCIY